MAHRKVREVIEKQAEGKQGVSKRQGDGRHSQAQPSAHTSTTGKTRENQYKGIKCRKNVGVVSGQVKICVLVQF
jgi:hypothetical protein